METVTVLNQTKDTVLGERVGVAATMVSRMVGLLGSSSLEPGTGLLIVPTQAIHTVAMRFPIDVVFLDRNWRVVHLRRAMPPFRMTGLQWRARCVLELPAGTIAESATELGDQLAIRQIRAETVAR